LTNKQTDTTESNRPMIFNIRCRSPRGGLRLRSTSEISWSSLAGRCRKTSSTLRRRLDHVGSSMWSVCSVTLRLTRDWRSPVTTTPSASTRFSSSGRQTRRQPVPSWSSSHAASTVRFTTHSTIPLAARSVRTYIGSPSA